jgi:hypothetical protein
MRGEGVGGGVLAAALRTSSRKRLKMAKAAIGIAVAGVEGRTIAFCSGCVTKNVCRMYNATYRPVLQCSFKRPAPMKKAPHGLFCSKKRKSKAKPQEEEAQARRHVAGEWGHSPDPTAPSVSPVPHRTFYPQLHDAQG